MKNILLIGIGGTGSSAVDILYKKINELGQQNDNNITAIVFDTDTGDVEKIENAMPISMADPASVGTICDRVGREYIREWFPCDDKAIRAQEMIRGAAQWRKKSYLAFLNVMNKANKRGAFVRALEQMTIDPSASCEVYIIASIAGGTGSGSFIPLALFVRRYLRRQLGKSPIINAMIALPDIFAEKQTRDNKIKVYANAYAILRELNAINLVCRSYNEGKQLRKKSPIRFKIGNINEPNVGLLFDASNPMFWTPEAAPFNQIFLLDRIPNVGSVEAHNMVLANSLYTLICTEIGAKFDSEASNHELLRSQSNGSNAIYAGISTSQIVFPKDTILNYLAHEKTVAASKDEWLVLHAAAEKKIAEYEQAEKDCNRRFILSGEKYSEIIRDELANKKDTDNPDMIINIIEEDITRFDRDGKTKIDVVGKFIEKINNKLISKLPSTKEYQEKIENQKNELINGDSKLQAEDVIEYAKTIKAELSKLYKVSVENIRSSSRSLREYILNFDDLSLDNLDSELSLIENILKNNKNFIHPVSALVQLCNLRLKLRAQLAQLNVEQWKELKRGDIKQIKDSLLVLNTNLDDSDEKGLKKSVYYNSKVDDSGSSPSNRFINIENAYSEVKNVNSKVCELDVRLLCKDGKSLIVKLQSEALIQFKKMIYENLAKDVDLLIEKYRSFFTRFEKEREDLIEETKTAKLLDSTSSESIINVCSSVKEKEQIRDEINEKAGPQTQAELIETNDIAGSGVFKSVFANAAAKKKDKKINEKDSTAYKNLFAGMVDAYRKSLGNSEEFSKLANYNVIEAMIAGAGEIPFQKLEEVFRGYFTKAQDIATPSLKISDVADPELVEPSYILVYMMSTETAKYLKKNAETLKLPLTGEKGTEDAIVRACAEEFVKRYAGNDNVRVVLVDDLPSNVLYCTGEIMDITPLRIEKFDELSEENVYYRNYVEALNRFKIHSTEMWNPHLGDNLHKRGYLPYMNPKKEQQCDDNMIKALLYALNSGAIVYEKGMSQSVGWSFKYSHDGIKEQMRTVDGNLIHDKNMAQLVAWMRNEDELIEAWSKEFDNRVKQELSKLPTPSSDADINVLETAITQSKYMKWLNNELFDMGTKEKPNKISIFDLALLVKASEESSGDCDDAERIISVAYDTFLKYCSHKTPMSPSPDRFIQVYNQQLQHFYNGVARNINKLSKSQGKIDKKSLFKQFAEWLNSCGKFKAISDDLDAINAKGEVQIAMSVTIESKAAEKAVGTLNVEVKTNKDDNGNSQTEEVVDTPTEE